ncbi:hypothetical protein ACFVTE_20580 [Arthrobacter sp. NPDC058097]|uniref:hypothetical protein n=1 Tax=Arthrobacter sp. NPDC058097 TaxID=3346340 RepID=UPI0036D9BC14
MRNVLKPLLVGILGLLFCLSGCAGLDGFGGFGGGSPQETLETLETNKPVRIYTEPVYTGQASGQLNAIGNKINDYVAAHPDTFSGAYFSSDSTKIFVGVAEPGDEAASVFERLADRLDPGRQRVITADAQWSWSELDAVKNVLVEKYLKESKGGVDSVGIDTSRDTVVISVLIERGDPRLEDNPTVAEIAKRYGDVVMFRQSLGPVSLNAK